MIYMQNPYLSVMLLDEVSAASMLPKLHQEA